MSQLIGQNGAQPTIEDLINTIKNSAQWDNSKSGLLNSIGAIVPILNRYRAGRRFGNTLTKVPFSKLKTSAFQTTTGAQAFTSHLEIALESPYDAVRFILPNNTNAIAGVFGATATAAAAGLDPTGNTANADGLTQNNAGTWTALTFGGASTVTLGAGTSVDRPSYTVSDWAALNSATRTDSTTQSSLPLNFSRFCIPLATGVVNIPQIAYTSDLYAQNSFTGNWGNDVTAGGAIATSHRIYRQILQNADGVTTPSNLTQSTLQCAMPVIVQYASQRSGIQVMAVGDSITEGSSPAQAGVSTTRAWSWLHMAVYGSSTADFPVELANFGWGAETSAQYTQRFFDLMKVVDADGFPVFRPDALVYSPFSPNDGSGTPSQATINASATQTAKVLALCQTLNIIPVLFTGLPNNNFTSGTDAFRKGLNTQLRAMGVSSDYLVMDMSAMVGDQATPAKYLTGYGCSDGIHPSDIAKAAMASVFSSLLTIIKGVR